MKHLSFLLVLLVLAAALSTGCRGDGEDSPTAGDTPAQGELPPLDLDDETRDLLLTWVDEKGDFHVVQRIADVPHESRNPVRVVVTTITDGTGDLVYVADLTAKRPDGKYAVKSMTRSAWDDVAASRRKSRIEALAPAPVPSGSAAAPPASAEPVGKLQAVVYGADWCKPCHDAERHLKRRGVSVTKKDVEKSSVARKEMELKLAKIGRAGASIPVIDVMGQVIVGFSTRSLDLAIARAREAETL